MLHDILLIIFSGASITAFFELVKFLLARKFQKEDKEDNYATRQELVEGLEAREAKGAERFDINSKAIVENTKAIEDLASISKDLKDNVLLLTNTITEMKGYNKTVGDAVNGIIHDRIIHNVDTYIDRKAITIEEISTLKSMYYPYKKLGGNGDVETAFEQAIKLPVVTKEESIELDKKNN